ncbi:HAMP domain-containing protein, partial [Hydrogenimonas sp.]
MRQIITLAFGVIILASLFAYGFALKGFSDAAESAAEIRRTDAIVADITTLEKEMLEAVHLFDRYLITGSDSALQKYRTQFNKVEKDLLLLKDKISDDTLLKKLSLLRKEAAQYREAAQTLTANSAKETDPITQKIMKILDEMHLWVLKIQKQTIETADNKILAMKSMMLLIAGASIVLAIFLTFYVSRFISRNLKTVQDAAHELASSDGDLTKRIPVIGKNEIGQMAEQINHFITKVQTTIKESKENGNENA